MKLENNENYQRINHEDGRIEFVPIKTNLDVGWVPEIGESYYCIGVFGDVNGPTWANSSLDYGMIAFHNVFPTLKIAESAREDMRRCNAVIKACRLADPDYVPDWGNTENKKWTVNFLNQNWYVDWHLITRYSPAYVSTKEKAEEACNYLRAWGVK